MAGKKKMRRREKKRQAQKDQEFKVPVGDGWFLHAPRRPFKVMLSGGEAEVRIQDIQVSKRLIEPDFLVGPLGVEIKRYPAERPPATPTPAAEPVHTERMKNQGSPEYGPALHRIGSIFDLAGLLVPKRIGDEQIGDALEEVRAAVAEGRPTWQVYLRAALALFWVFLHTIGEARSLLQGKDKKAK